MLETEKKFTVQDKHSGSNIDSFDTREEAEVCIAALNEANDDQEIGEMAYIIV